jgi:hypothetical protein
MSRMPVRANANFDDLGDDEAMRFIATFGGLFRAWEEVSISTSYLSQNALNQARSLPLKL